jgi:hypothetical protein
MVKLVKIAVQWPRVERLWVRTSTCSIADRRADSIVAVLRATMLPAVQSSVPRYRKHLVIKYVGCW